MDSFDTNYIFTNNKNLGQYDQNAIPSQMKVLTNMAHFQYHPSQCYIKAIPKVWWTKMKSLLSYRVNELIWH